MADLLGSIGGPLVSAGIGLIGSKMTADATNKAARLNAIAQATENNMAREYNEKMYWIQAGRDDAAAARNEALQREFAQSGIQWRAADARAAGIHPAFALGAPGASYSASVGTASPPTYTPGEVKPYAGASMGSGIASMGQDIGRAITAGSQELERQNQIAAETQKAQLQNVQLQNVLTASQIRKNLQPATGPALPTQNMRPMIDGQGNAPKSTDRVDVKKMETQHRSSENPAAEPADIADIGYARTGKSTYMPVPSDINKDRIEENAYLEASFVIRNLIAPLLGMNMMPPNVPLKSKDHTWFMHPLKGYKQRKKDWVDKAADGFDSYTKNMFPKLPWQSNWK